MNKLLKNNAHAKMLSAKHDLDLAIEWGRQVRAIGIPEERIEGVIRPLRMDYEVARTAYLKFD